MINRIRIWGDSIMKGVILNETTGRYEKLNDKSCVSAFARTMHIDIINNAKFGMNSDKGRLLMEKESNDGNAVDAEVIFFGGNDVDHNWSEIAANPIIDHKPNVTLSQFRQNITEMVQMIKARKAVPVLVTIPPISSERYFKWFSRKIDKRENILKWLQDINFIYRSQEMYSEAIKKVAIELDCVLIDIRQEFLKQRNYLDFLCADGIHPNEKGHRLMEKAFVEFAVSHI